MNAQTFSDAIVDVTDMLKSLPEKYSIVLYLYYYEEYSAKEIGEILHRNESTVRTHLMREKDFEKLSINAYSQKIYFYVTNLPDQGIDICMTPENRSLYHFSLEGTDNNGNKVFCTLEEVKDGYGYFLIRAYSDAEGLDTDVKYYDMQMEYIWDDPEHLIGTDEEEGIFYGRMGTVGEKFRIACDGLQEKQSLLD